jgi:hypothetical protein
LIANLEKMPRIWGVSLTDRLNFPPALPWQQRPRRLRRYRLTAEASRAQVSRFSTTGARNARWNRYRSVFARIAITLTAVAVEGYGWQRGWRATSGR